MSHFPVTVIVKETDALEGALAPFDENGEWFAEGTRWDWWVVGGRWPGLLIDRYGNRGDIFRKSEIEWDAVGQGVFDRLREAYRYYTDPETAHWAMGRDTEPQPGETEESFVHRRFEPFNTHAFLDLNGEWHENGRMGFFGVTVGGEEGEQRETWAQEYQRLLAAVPDDAFVCIVDCHV